MTQHQFTIAPHEANLRLDKILTSRFPDHSRTYFQYLIKENQVLINGAPPKKKDKPNIGDEISLTLIASPESSALPEEIPLSILYEDEHLIAINKPRGMVAHPGAGNPSKTVVNALLYHTKSLPQTSPIRPGIVHRLDKETSGVMIAAKTELAHTRLVDLFKRRKIHKEYLAICENVPKEGVVSLPIGRHPIKRKEMTILDTGREAITQITVLKKSRTHSLVLAEPKTGRTHQIRVHLKALKAPIVGDKTYGNQHKQDSPMLLHAHKLTFTHPILGTLVQLCAPIPKEFSFFLEK